MAPSASNQSPKPTTNGTSGTHTKSASNLVQDEKAATSNSRTQADEIKSDQSAGGGLKELCAVLQKALDLPGFKDLESLTAEVDLLREGLQAEQTVRKTMTRESREEAAKQEQTEEALRKSQDEVQKLKKRLQTENKDATAKFAALEKERQEAESRAKEVDIMCQSQLKELGTRETKLIAAESKRKEAIKKESELKGVISNLEHRVREMEDVQTQLATLRSFSAETEKVEANAATHLASLESLFKITSKTLQDLVFNHEMDFTDDAHDDWDTYKFKKSVKSIKVPLPDSNSLLAKQMRFASALAVLSRILVDKIFRPMYISSEQDWINNSLRDMDNDEDTLREHHVRSVLLNIDPAAQLQVGQELAKAAWETATGILKLIVAPTHHEELQSRLKTICNESLELWVNLQRVEQHVVPDLTYGTADEWKALALPAGQRSSGRSSNPPTSQNRVSRASEALAEGASSLQRAEELPGPEVWPAFTFGDEVLTRGYYLRGQVIVDAKKEERAAEEEASRISMKQRFERKPSVSTKRTNLKPFLSQGGS